MINKNLYIKTLGCQINEYDSLFIKNTLIKDFDFKIINSEKNANILLINTCAIRTSIENKIFTIIDRWKNLKKKDPAKILIVMGCFASKEGKILYKKISYVDIIIGPRSINNFTKILNIFLQRNKNVIDISIFDNKLYNNINHYQINYSPLISIMDGCNKYCTFCVVPYTRGLEIYRDIKNIIQEILYLSENGVTEITLLGQNVNAFVTNFYNKLYSFFTLIVKIANIKIINKIKFITSHPIEICINLINIYRGYNKLFNHLHLPMQSGSNKILNIMNRGYNIKEYLNKISRLKLLNPTMTFSTDIIIGFPKETYNDFYNTLRIINKINFNNLFVFMYSKRSGTFSEKLHPKIPLFVKKKRMIILKENIKKKNNIDMIGTIHNILIMGFYNIETKNILYGYTENNNIVFFFCNFKYIGMFMNFYISYMHNSKMFGILTKTS